MSRESIGDINLEMLKEFSEAHGISGNEKEVSRVMKNGSNHMPMKSHTIIWVR